MYDLEIKTPPTREPVLLREAKKHLGVSHQEDDILIKGLIQAARQSAEIKTHRQIMTATVVATFDRFPEYKTPFNLPRGQFNSLLRVEWFDETNTGTQFDVTDFETFGPRDYTRIVPTDNWPDACKVEIEWTCGFGTEPENVPQLLRQGMLLTLSHFYEVREPIVVGTIATKIPETIDTIYAQFSLGDEFINYDPSSLTYSAST